MAKRSRQPHDIKVSVETRFLDDQSAPRENRFVFAYTVTISNRGGVAARLLSRHWVITDANGKVQEVRGEGVVGEQPWMRPGDDFQYTSGAVLETAVGTMTGTYEMLSDDGTRFDAAIPAFTLSVPRTLH
ncbi:MAG TPA: Co2+/Mg2+ efflux protein ApaG [Candidatus Saccharimonadia bacterium]|nr:Co2+/Mg2+ efflux protein ApaG [Candidatus Saccharimonadia bacterium]